MDWSYVAGFLDGEGSISLARGGSYRYKGVRREPTYRPAVSLSNTNREVLDAIATFVGIGKVHVHREERGNKTGFVYMLTGQRASKLLAGVLPHLIVKREQAEIALAFIERRAAQRTRPFTDEDYDFVRRMRTVNARAPGRGTPIRPLPAPTHKLLGIP